MDALIFITIAFLFFGVLSAYLLTKVKTKYYLKFLLIPIIIGTALLCFSTYRNMLGEPIEGTPHGKFLFVAYGFAVNHKSLYLELWVRQHGKSKMYTFPFTAALGEALRQAKNQTQDGADVEGSFDGDFDGKPGEGKPSYIHNSGSLGLHVIPMQEILPPKK